MLHLRTLYRSIVFQACAGVARHDIHIMMLLLPYAVLVVVGTGDPKLKELVTTEVNAVLQVKQQLVVRPVI